MRRCGTYAFVVIVVAVLIASGIALLTWLADVIRDACRR